MSKTGFKICNPDKDSEIAYIKEIKEKTEIGTDGVSTKFYEPILDKIILKKETKEKIWKAILEAEGENRFPPFIILVPKKLITKKKFLLEENPIPFAENILYVVPYIRKIMVYETWDEKDDE